MTYQTFHNASVIGIVIADSSIPYGQHPSSGPIFSSIKRLLEDTATGSIVSHIASEMLSRGMTLYVFSDLPAPTYTGTGPNGPSITIQSGGTGPSSINPYPDVPDGMPFIYMPSGFMTGRYDGYSTDTGDFQGSYDRTLFHEIFHLWTFSANASSQLSLQKDIWKSGTNAAGGQPVDYGEEIAITAENFFYAGSSLSFANDDWQYRVGHNTPDTGGSISDLDVDEGGPNGNLIFRYLSDKTSNVIKDNDKTVGIQFEGHLDGGDFYKKTFYTPGYKPLDGSNTSYDHYIIHRTGNDGPNKNASGNYYLGENGATINNNFKMILDGVMADDPKGGLNTAASLVHHIISIGISLNGFGYTEDGSTGIGQDILSLDTFVGIGSDRHADGNGSYLYDISGPVPFDRVIQSQGGTNTFSGKTISPVELIINESNSTEGTLIFGGSGYVKTGIFPGPIDDYVDASQSYDWVVSGSGNDLIISGTGQNGNFRNLINGGAGNDVIIGRSADDNLFGGIGNDIFHPGAGSDVVHGGAGMDIVSYFDSSEPVNINLMLNLGFGGDAEGDKFFEIESFVGTNGDDVFVGRGSGNFFYGGDGIDIFYLKDGDYAQGGEGQDIFRIQTEVGKIMSVGILDPDNDDIIFVNGVQVSNSTFFAGGTNYTAKMVLGDNNPECIATLQISEGDGSMYSPSTPPLLNIHLGYYESGDAGISPYIPTSYQIQPFGFFGTEVLI